MTPNWLDLIKQFAPMILAFTPAAAIAPYIVPGIEAAEALKNASGQEKLAHAIETTHVVISAVNAAKPGTIDPATADAAITSGINTVIAVTNLIHRQPAAA